MKVGIHPKAEAELVAAFEFYESQVPSLGYDFLNEFEQGKVRVVENPDTWPLTRKGARRHLLHRFPFWLVYLRREDEIFVIAVAHTSRRPFYWQTRIGS